MSEIAVTPGRSGGTNRDAMASPRVAVVCIAVAVVLLVAIGLAIAFVDAPVATWVRGHRFSPGAKRFFRVARLPGNVPFTAIVVVAIAWVRRRGWRDAAAVIGVGAIASLIATAAKLAFGRRRPSAAVAPGEWLSFAQRSAADLAPGSLSFPSGDATLAFATATTLAYVWPRAAAPAFAWATLVAVTRVLQGVHHPSDVAAGALVGATTAILAARVAPAHFPRWERGGVRRVLRHVPTHAPVEGRAL